MPSCPVCKVEFAAKLDIHAVSPVVQRMLRKLEIRCDRLPHTPLITPHLRILSQDENIRHICQSIVDKIQALCPPVTDDTVHAHP